MTSRLLTVFRDKRGSAAIEFAFAVPVIVMLVWGIFQFSLVLEAQAGMEHALGEGARYATILDPSTDTSPTTTQVQAKITGGKFGLGAGTWDTPNIDTTHASGAGGYWVITVTYHLPTNFLFFTGPTITLTQSKTVYLAQPS